MCQRVSGAAALPWVSFPLDAFAYVSGAPRVHRSSKHGQREFCADCGSQLAFRSGTRPETVEINAGTLDDPSSVVPRYHIWFRSRVAWFDTKDDLPRYADGGPSDRALLRPQDSRDAAAVRLFPPLVPLLTVLAAFVLDWLWKIDPDVGIPSPHRYWIGGGMIAGALLGLGGWSVWQLRRDGQSENPWRPTTRILESGPFRVTRNPMYLQMVVVCIGLAIVLNNPWLLLLTPVCGWALLKLAILPEEEYLERKFGDEYIAYKLRVRRWL